MKRPLRSWLWRVSVDQEVNEEIALHIELRTRELVERGMDPNAPARSSSRESAIWVTSSGRASTLAESEIARCD